MANELLRKKYFVNSGLVKGIVKKAVRDTSSSFSKIIDASAVTVAKNPVRLGQAGGATGNQIKIDLVRAENKIKSINISCPCGRHAELNCEYE